MFSTAGGIVGGVVGWMLFYHLFDSNPIEAGILIGSFFVAGTVIGGYLRL